MRQERVPLQTPPSQCPAFFLFPDHPFTDGQLVPLSVLAHTCTCRPVCHSNNKHLNRASTKSRQQAAAASEDSTSSSGLSPAAAELMAVVAEALAKLLLHQRTWLRRYTNYTATLPNSSTAAADVEMMAQQQQQPLPPDSQQQQARLLQRGLALLLQLQFHPASAGVTQVCQRLSVFFDVFSAASIGNRLQLAAACVPAARQALHVTNTKKHPAPLLVKYVLQLLQHARLRDEQELADGEL